jgi:hypothetical protein
MAQNNIHRPCATDRGLPLQLVCGKETDEVDRSIHLFFNLREKRHAKRLLVHHSVFRPLISSLLSALSYQLRESLIAIHHARAGEQLTKHLEVTSTVSGPAYR